MRNQWEQAGGRDLDAPANLTERDIKSLRRRAGFAVFASLLSLACLAALGWLLAADTGVLPGFGELRSRLFAERGVAEPSVGSADPAQPSNAVSDSIAVTEAPGDSSKYAEQAAPTSAR